MNKSEFKLVIASLTCAYKSFNLESKIELEFWYHALEDLDYKVCAQAVLQITLQDEFSPSIAKIRSKCLEIQGVKTLTSEEALSIVTKATSKFGRYRTDEAMEWIKEQDESVWKVVKAIGLTNYCNADPNFIRHIVVKMYEQTKKEDINHLMLASRFNDDISKIRSHTIAITENY